MPLRPGWVLVGAVWLAVGVMPGAALGGAVPVEGPATPVDAIVVRKAARELVLYAGGQAVLTIPHIQLGAVPVGPKHFQGDQRTPEGRYTVDFGKADSDFHLALHISYPEARDRALAQANGRMPGGAIYIHGQPNDWPRGRVTGDWTAGCIALTNAEIETLWRLVPEGTPKEIRP